MRRDLPTWVLSVLLLGSATTPAEAADEPVSWAPVVGELPAHLLEPEGRTRWEAAGLTLGEPLAAARFVDADAGVSSRSWLAPHEDPRLLEAANPRRLELSVVDGAGRRPFIAVVRRVGLGWLDLPDGPREVVLQRAVIHEGLPGGRGYRPARIAHRFVDPRSGVVAEVERPADGEGPVTARVAMSVDKGSGLKIYADQIDTPLESHVAYGFDRGAVAVSALTPDGHTTIGELVAASSWDFSAASLMNSVAEVASTRTLVTAEQTCNHDRCGFDRPGAVLAREDKNWDDLENLNVTLSVQEREDRVDDVTIWLRAGVTDEGEEAIQIGQGESRICHVDDGRTEVPLFRFAHQDAGGFYMQNGDAWGHTPFACEQNIFASSVCPDPCDGFCPNNSFACSDHPGVISNEVVNEGPVTLPSGHTFPALVVRNVAEFCAGPACIELFSQDVRTVVYLWMVPELGTVVRLMSSVNEADATSFTVLEETDIKFGLFPPRSITAGATTESSIELSWDPGLVTHRIDGYRIYWDTDSGADTPYAFDSFNNAGQVSIVGATATIGALDPGTEYFVTVTAVSEFINPRTGIMTTFESLLYPTSVPAQPTPIPAELTVSTEGGVCLLTEEVGGLTADRLPAGVELCWDASTDPCLDGYSVLGAATPDSAAGFSTVVADTGLATCTTIDTDAAYFLTVTTGPSGTGPWGHFDR